MTTKNVYQRLNDAREEFHTLELKKTGYNKFAGYNYFELGDFLIPAMNVFRKHGLIGVVQFGTELAEIVIINTDNIQDFHRITSPMSSAALKGCHEVQNLGAVQTYLRRYLWVAALEIVEHDALDATTGKGDQRVESIKKEPPNEDDKLLKQYEEYASRGMASLQSFHGMVKAGPAKTEFWNKHGERLKGIAKAVKDAA